jgi:hypothetical protein
VKQRFLAGSSISAASLSVCVQCNKDKLHYSNIVSVSEMPAAIALFVV